MTYVLLSDPWVRKTFDVYNVLRRNHPSYRPLILTHDADARDRRRLARVYDAPMRDVAKTSPERFADDLGRLLADHPDDRFVYLPMEEDTTLLFYAFIAEHRPDNLFYALPSEDAFRRARDKGALVDFAEAHDLPVPEPFSFDALGALQRDFVPLVAKPRVGSGAIGLRFIDAPEDLAALRELPADDYLLQRKLSDPGAVRGAFFLFRDGEPVAYYGHERLRTYPTSGGVTVYSRVDYEPALKAAGERLLRALGWSGIAMVEFLWDERDAEYKIIEVNPRLWGSVLLSEFAGTELLGNYVRSALGEPLAEPENREDVFIRWLVPFDVLTYAQSGFRTRGFWRAGRDRTCYVNMTYADPAASLRFHLYSMIDPGKLRKLAAKVFGGRA